MLVPFFVFAEELLPFVPVQVERFVVLRTLLATVLNFRFLSGENVRSGSRFVVGPAPA